jgi:hypothetical protein
MIASDNESVLQSNKAQGVLTRALGSSFTSISIVVGPPNGVTLISLRLLFDKTAPSADTADVPSNTVVAPLMESMPVDGATKSQLWSIPMVFTCVLQV